MARVVHFELFTKSPEQVGEFYKEVFGWDVSRWGEEPYWLATTGEEGQPGINGGIAPMNPQISQPVVNTIDVSDIDAVIGRVQELGGGVLIPKQTMPGLGWLAYLVDPGGIVFGVMQSNESAGK